MIKTRIYSIEELIKKETKLDIKTTLQEGKNVVFPTETVYGIGANALSEKGIQNIYLVKGRPSDNPLIMHLSSSEDLNDYVYIEQDYINSLIKAFWPGPMTLVFKKKSIVPNYFTGGLDTVGIRVPSSEVARDIIDIAGVPLCAPSANISGTPSSTLFEHVFEDFDGKVDIIINGGKSEVGIESTVIDVTGDVPVILRPGMITAQMVEELTHAVKISKELENDEIPKAPGMKYKHYAPKGNLCIVDGSMENVIQFINNKIKDHTRLNQRVGVITTSEYKDSFETRTVYVIGKEKNDIEIASNLFAALRDMDNKKMDFIYSLSFSDGLYSEAIMNRLLKAANKNIIKL